MELATHRPNPPDKDKQLASIDVLKMLLRSGSQRRVQKEDSAAGGARRHQSDSGGYATLSRDEIHGYCDPIDAIKLFIKAGADVNATNDLGFTVHYAAQLGRNRMVELLVANGAKLDVKNKADKAPLDLASGPARASTAALIKQLMAK